MQNCTADQRNSDFIDDIVGKLCDLFIRRAKDTFGTKQLHSNKKPGKRFNKP